MKIFRMTITIIAFTASSAVAFGSCWVPVVEEVAVSSSAPTRLKLEASRVAGLAERGFLYDLGREKIVVKTDSLATESFLHAVLSGVCTVSVDVVLIPSGETREGKIFGARLIQQKQKTAVPPSPVNVKASAAR